MVEKGIMIHFSPWNMEVHTLEKDWVDKAKIWVNFIGLPHYLWSIKNAVSTAEEVEDGFVEADNECPEFNMLDVFRIKINVDSY